MGFLLCNWMMMSLETVAVSRLDADLFILLLIFNRKDLHADTMNVVTQLKTGHYFCLNLLTSVNLRDFSPIATRQKSDDSKKLYTRLFVRR